MVLLHIWNCVWLQLFRVSLLHSFTSKVNIKKQHKNGRSVMVSILKSILNQNSIIQTIELLQVIVYSNYGSGGLAMTESWLCNYWSHQDRWYQLNLENNQIFQVENYVYSPTNQIHFQGIPSSLEKWGYPFVKLLMPESQLVKWYLLLIW